MKVALNLIKNADGLYTVRNYKEGLLLFLSSILGSVFGIMGAFSGLMRFVEGNSRIMSKELKKREYLQNMKNTKSRIRTTLSEDFEQTSAFKPEGISP